MRIYIQKINTLTAYVLALFVCLTLLNGAALPKVEAAPNMQINYQGKLTDSSNVAVPDGVYNMRFWLLTSGSVATTSAVWTESLTGSNRVQVTNGLFSVMLGSTSPLTSVDFNQTLYLGVEIGGSTTPQWDGEMSPRKVLGAVPAAFEADKLDGLTSSQFVRTDATSSIATSSVDTLLTITQNGVGDIFNIFDGGTEVFSVLDGGSIGVGTSSPVARFAVAGNSYFGGNMTATGTLSLTGLATFASGFVSQSSSTIFELTAPILLGTNATITNATTTNLATTLFRIGSDTITDITGTNLSITNGVLNVASTADGVSNWTYNGSYLAPSTTSAGILLTGSSTIQNLTMTNSTSTSATATNLFVSSLLRAATASSSYASTTGLTATNAYLTALTLPAFSGGVLTTNASGVTAASTTIGDSYITDALTLSGGTIGSNSVSGTLTTTGALTIGDGGDTLTIDTSGWDVSNNIFTGISGLIVTGTSTLGFASSSALTVSGNSFFSAFTATSGTTTNLFASVARFDTASSTYASTTRLSLFGSLFDRTSSAGTNGMVLQTTGSGVQWVATSSLGFAGADGVSNWLFNGSRLSPSTTVGIGIFASSTIGNGTATGGLTISGGATTTGTSTLGIVNFAALNTAADNWMYWGGTRFINASSTGENLSIGLGAGSGVTSGARNTAVGDGTMVGNTGGDDNVAVGYGALQSTSIGDNNVAIGSLALSASGYNNSNSVAIGRAALQSSDTGGDNIAVGFHALWLSTSGAQNIAIGREAGADSFVDQSPNRRSIIDDQMTFLGHNASRFEGTASTSQLTYGTAIGARARVGCSNCLALGGLGTYAVKVGIGTATPSSLLTISNSVSTAANTALFTVASTTGGTATTTLFTILADGRTSILSASSTYASTTNLTLFGDLFDTNQSAGSKGNLLMSTGTSTIWVATSTLGLSAAGDGVSNWLFNGSRLSPSTTVGIGIFASSTIGDGTATGGLTISGGATTTGNTYIGGNLSVGTTSRLYVAQLSGATSNAVDPILQVLNYRTPAAADQNNSLELLSPNLVSDSGVYLALGKNASLNNRAAIEYRYQGDGSLSNAIRFGFYGNERLLNILASGNVGIGTSSPQYRLTVSTTTPGSGDLVGVAYGQSANDGSGYAFNTSNTTVGALRQQRVGVGDYALQFHNWNGSSLGEMMTIRSSGNVGIGTTSPSSVLTISNKVSTPANTALFTIASTTGGTATTTVFAIDANGDISMPSTESAITIAGSFGGETVLSGNSVRAYSAFGAPLEARFNGGGSTGATVLRLGIEGSNPNYLQSWEIAGSQAGFVRNVGVHTSPLELSTVGGLGITGGNVAVGTTSPWAKFSIMNAYGSTTPLFDIATTTSSAFATSSIFRVNHDGRVGIGTTSPYANLTVAGSFGLSGSLFDRTSSAGTNGMVLQTTGSGVQWVATSSLGLGGGGSSNWTDNGTYLTPLTATDGLSISGSSTIQNLTMVTATTTNLLATNAFNVSAGGAYRYNGVNLIQASTTRQNYFLGESAGNLAATGTDNIGMGNSALNALTEGLGNAAFGDSALAALITGNYNTAIGSGALELSSNDADNNVAVGHYSMWSSSGSNNVALGAVALFNADGSNNIGIGLEAMRNASGDNNVAIGSEALVTTTSGTQNVAIGDRGMFTNTSGSYNTALGGRSLYYNGSATNTTAIGYEAGLGADGLTASQNNVFLGYRSGYANTTGSNNTLLGYQTGDALSSGSNNVLLGYDIDAPASTTSNFLSVGNLIFGRNIDGTGNTVSSGNIGIGTSSPWARLSVQGVLGSQTALFDVATTTSSAYATSSIFRVGHNSRVSIGSTTPESTSFTIQRTGILGGEIGGIKQYHSFANTASGSIAYADNAYLLNSSTATTTLVGKIIRIEDSTAFGNTVRGLEVQAQRGTNTRGENTALSGFGRTFGVRGATEGDAGDTFVPAGVFADLRGTTQGNALRAYSGTITTSSLVQLFQDTSAFTGTGLLMNFGNSGGSFASTSSKFIDLKNSGTSKFTVTAQGTTTIGDGTTANMAGLQIGYGGLCVDNDGSCTASTTGRITSVSSASGNSDLAEMYFSSDNLMTGEIVALHGGLTIERAEETGELPLLGVVSTKPGVVMGYDDTSLVPGEVAFPIALKGRVPVRLSTENGPIKKGDRITLSSVPGVGMKATESGMTVGIALEDFDGDTAYSAGYLNQFGDDLVKARLQPRSVETDVRTQDGCSYGGGGAQGETPCVKEKVSKVKVETVVVDNRTEVLAELAQVEAETAVTPEGASVHIGQVIMFVDLDHHMIAREGDLLKELFATSTLENGNGTETLWDRIQTLAQNFVDGVLKVAGIKTDELCVGSVCVDEETFLQMVQSATAVGGVETPPDPDESLEEDTEEEDGNAEGDGDGGSGGDEEAVPPPDEGVGEESGQTEGEGDGTDAGGVEGSTGTEGGAGDEEPSDDPVSEEGEGGAAEENPSSEPDPEPTQEPEPEPSAADSGGEGTEGQ